MVMSLESSILDHLLESSKKRDFRELSQGIEQLRSRDLLTDENKAKISSWIDEYFPTSLRTVAKSLLELDEDEKEQEEKIPAMHPRNICSSDTQQDLIGNAISPLLDRVITFLLPKSKKSECISESDMMNVVSSRKEDLYLYSAEKKSLIKSVIVYRLPTSGVWIVGNPMYFLLFRSYQLESFGKHIISSEKHHVGSIWRQEHELFLAKPLHWSDLVAFIQNNTSIPSLSSCACMFKPKEEDWSVQAKENLSINECHWMIPTWNGIPIFLGETCGEVLTWTFESLTPKFPQQINKILELEGKMSAEASSGLVINSDTSQTNVADVGWTFIWPDSFSTPDVLRLEEISARKKSWPDIARLTVETEGDNSKNFTRFTFTDGSVFKFNQSPKRISRHELILKWKLNIVSPLSSIPATLLPKSLSEFIALLSKIFSNVEKVRIIQGEKSTTANFIKLELIYANGEMEEFDESEIENMSQMIKSVPLIRLSCLIGLKEALSTENPIYATISDKIVLPAILPLSSTANHVNLEYVVDITQP